MARPSKYSDELVKTICDRIADGESLRSICNGDDMPSNSAVMSWLKDKPEFLAQYARAREWQADNLFDQALDILHENFSDNVQVQAAKLRLDAIKWTAGKLAPKKYSDKVDLTSSDGTMSPDRNIRVTFIKPKPIDSANS